MRRLAMEDSKQMVQRMLAQQRREKTLAELNNNIDFTQIINLAVKRARKKAVLQGEKKDMFGTWDQHNGTKGSVLDEFLEILKELGLSRGPTSIHMVEWDRQYGTGQKLYHA